MQHIIPIWNTDADTETYTEPKTGHVAEPNDDSDASANASTITETFHRITQCDELERNGTQCHAQCSHYNLRYNDDQFRRLLIIGRSAATTLDSPFPGERNERLDPFLRTNR